MHNKENKRGTYYLDGLYNLLNVHTSTHNYLCTYKLNKLLCLYCFPETSIRDKNQLHIKAF